MDKVPELQAIVQAIRASPNPSYDFKKQPVSQHEKGKIDVYKSNLNHEERTYTIETEMHEAEDEFEAQHLEEASYVEALADVDMVSIHPPLVVPLLVLQGAIYIVATIMQKGIAKMARRAENPRISHPGTKTTSTRLKFIIATIIEYISKHRSKGKIPATTDRYTKHEQFW